MKAHLLPVALAGILALAGPAGADLPFRLARTDGSGWVSPGSGRVSVYLFWDETCPACLVELDTLPDLQIRFSGVQYVAVYTGPRRSARRVLARYKLPPRVESAYAPADARGFMAGLGNQRGVLPFSVVFDRQGRRCAVQFSALTANTLVPVLRVCGG